MKLTVENVHEDLSRDTYWSRIHLKSNSSNLKTTVLICASFEYLWNRFQTININSEVIEEWMDGVIEKWKNKGEEIFKKRIYYDVYANSQEGINNGMDFLEKEVLSEF